MKIFITGSEGFIGHHLAKALVMAGYDVTCGVLYNSNLDIGNLKYWGIGRNAMQFKTIFFDIRDKNSYQHQVNNSDVIIHLAGLIDVAYSYSSYNQYYETNVFGTLQLLDSIRKSTNDPRLLYISSSEVYGTPVTTPISEDFPLNPQSPYAASKASADLLVQSFVKSFDINAVIIRLFNTFGARQSSRAIIPYLIEQYRLPDKELQIGNIIPRRDFNHISDTVAGIILVMEKIKTFEIINIGSGKMFSIETLIQYMEKISYKHKTIKINRDRVRPKNSEVMELQADISKAKRLLGYEPQANLYEEIFRLWNYEG